MWVRFGIISLLIIWIYLPVVGQSDSNVESNSQELGLLAVFTSETPNSDREDWAGELNGLITKFHQKQKGSKNHQSFLEKIFYKVHQRYLKDYRQYSGLDQLMDRGSYDCVSGTALYALILQELGFDCRLFETEFHVYMLVGVEQGTVLIECTDPQYGFVTHPGLLDQRIKFYKSEGCRKYQGEIDLRQLAGLQYYNLAIDAYNHQDGTEALGLLEKALELYPSPRFVEFRDVVHLTLGIRAQAQQ